MKKTFIYSLALLTVFCFAFRTMTDYPQLEIGKSIPKAELKLGDVSGKTVTLSDSRGKNGLLVIFSCNTCPFVVKNESRIKEMTAYALKNEIGVVVVNSNESQRDGDDSFAAMKKYKAEKQFSGSYIMDTNSELANAFGATHTPEIYLFSKAGILAYKGGIDDAARDESAVKVHFLKDAIDAVVSGSPVKINSTKSVGCSIKRKEA
jgi:thioredoxin-related protein